MNTSHSIRRVAKTAIHDLAVLGEVIAAIHGTTFLVGIIGWLIAHASVIAF